MEFDGWPSLVTAATVVLVTQPGILILTRFVDAHPDLWSPNSMVKKLLSYAMIAGTSFLVASLMGVIIDFNGIMAQVGTSLVLLGTVNGSVDKMTVGVSDKINSMLIKKEGE